MRSNPIATLLDLLYPPKCAFCGELLDRKRQSPLCPACQEAFEEEKTKRCYACRHRHAACLCDIRRMNGRVDSLHLIGYTGRSKVGSRLVLINKDRNLKKVNAFLAAELAERLSAYHGQEHTVVTHCPRKDAGRRDAGYDQAERLARALAERLALPYDRLIARRGGASQKDLTASERRENAEKAYALTKKGKETACGKTIILVDDVSTTGATLDKCAELLLEKGAGRIVYAYIAKSNRGMEQKT